MSDGRKSDVVTNYGIFSSMLKNYLSIPGIISYRFMPPVCDWWFLTNPSLFIEDKKLTTFKIF